MRRVLCMLSVAAGAALFAVAPASADPVELRLPVTASSHTDIRTPNQVLTGSDLPVGAWRDEENQYHSAKSYVTVDLTRLHGARIFGAHVYTRETAVNDCAKPRAVELWRTKVAEQPTWSRAPKELTRFEGRVTGACIGLLSWDVADAIKAAVAAGQDRATFALRMAGGKQFDPGHGRRYAPVTVEVSANTPPGAATDPQVNGEPCDGREFLLSAPPTLKATVVDPDPLPGFEVRYVVTDVADPAKRVEGTTYGVVPYRVPNGFLEHGHTYEWTAHGEDGYDTGPASAPCRFTTDLHGPAEAPLVTTTDFPGTGAGFPGTFTFDARGDEDAVAFSYSVDSQFGTVPADRPGGTATATLRLNAGPRTIEVRSIDRLGLRSPTTTYSFFVRSTSPTVTGPEGEVVLGSEVPLTFRSAEPGVVEFVYEVGGVTSTVPAVDGTASVTIRVTDAWVTRPYVRARTAAGDLTSVGGRDIHTADSTPVITRDGGLVTFAPGMPGVAAYVYSVAFGTEVVVEAPDGTVTLDLGEDVRGEVRSRTADGLESRTASF